LNITAEIRDRILNSLDIVDIVSDVVDLHRKGANYWALCPFHGEKTPSFSVSPTKGIYKCFGCGVSGNIITFQMEYYKMTYPEAVKELARRAGIFIEERSLSPVEKEKQSKRDLALSALKAASDYYHKMLRATSGKQAFGYLRKREFSDELIDKFELGYSPDAWDALIVELKKQNYSEQTLIEAGLVIERDDGDIYDRFRNRVMFPIHDHLGKIVGFGARLLDDEIKQAKYINSPQTEVYDKSKILYGLFHSKDEIRRIGYALLTEGYADVLTLQQAGYKNSIASSGTSLTKEQLTSLFRYCKTIYLVFDADEAGVKATERGLELALEHGFNVMIVELPQGEDPDSIIRNLGGKNFQVYINEAVNFMRFLINLYNKNNLMSNPSDKANSLRTLINLINKIPDNLQHDGYLNELRILAQISEKQLKQLYISKSKIKSVGQESNKDKQELPRTENHGENEIKIDSDKNKSDSATFKEQLLPQEELLIQLLLNYKEAYLIMKDKYSIDEQKFQSDIGKSIIKNLLRIRAESSEVSKTYFDDIELSKFEKDIITDLIMNEPKFSENWKDFSNRNIEKDIERNVKDSVIKLELFKLEKNRDEISLRLLEIKNELEKKNDIGKDYLESMEIEQNELLRQQVDLSNKRKKLNQLYIR